MKGKILVLAICLVAMVIAAPAQSTSPLPSALTLSQSGQVGGNVAATDKPGAYPFGVQVCDANGQGCVSANGSITVQASPCVIQFTMPQMPVAVPGTAYTTVNLTATLSAGCAQPPKFTLTAPSPTPGAAATPAQ